MSVRVTLSRMDDTKLPTGWCRHCGEVVDAMDLTGRQCCQCDRTLTPLNQLTKHERSIYNFQCWMWEVQDADKWGPSPGGAAGELKCSRSMIDKLVSTGVLERSEYKHDGHYVVMISARSIKQAKENKAKYGQWKPRDDWHDLPAGKPGRGK